MDTPAPTPAIEPAALRETPVDQTKRLPPEPGRGLGFSPTRLFADNAFAARMWFLVACGAVGFCFLQPYLIIGAYRVKERVVVLDGGGTFSVSPLLGFEEAKELHESMALPYPRPRDFALKRRLPAQLFSSSVIGDFSLLPQNPVCLQRHFQAGPMRDDSWRVI